MKKQFSSVSSKYGAPMGRHSRGTADNCDARTVKLFKVNLDTGGYDDGGAYWGHGGAIYAARDDGGAYFATCRANSRAHAAYLLEVHPDLLARPLGDFASHLFKIARGHFGTAGKPFALYAVAAGGALGNLLSVHDTRSDALQAKLDAVYSDKAAT